MDLGLLTANVLYKMGKETLPRNKIAGLCWIDCAYHLYQVVENVEGLKKCKDRLKECPAHITLSVDSQNLVNIIRHTRNKLEKYPAVKRFYNSYIGTKFMQSLIEKALRISTENIIKQLESENRYWNFL